MTNQTNQPKEISPEVKACVEELNAVLGKHGFVLQPYMIRGDLGTVAAVRLVEAPKEAETPQPAQDLAKEIKPEDNAGDQ